MNKRRIADLTVEQLETLIKQTVQQAVAEVLIEFSIAAEIEEEITSRAEITDYLRAAFQERPLPLRHTESAAELDD